MTKKNSEVYASLDAYWRSNIWLDTDKGCWILLKKATNKDGYTTTNWNGIFASHRLSYEYYKGPIPNKMEVCHHCDVPACINPNHLFLGTHADNMQDRLKKGRTPKGWKLKAGSNAGKRNPMYGKTRINNGIKEKAHDKNLPIPAGWILGRIKI